MRLMILVDAGIVSMGPLLLLVPEMKKVAETLLRFKMSSSLLVCMLGPSSNVRAMRPGDVHLLIISPKGTLLLSVSRSSPDVS
jgi:hypothetical protein